MTNYLDELNRLQFSAEEKSAMVQNLATAERKCTRRGLPYRGLVAAAAAVSLLLGAAGATSLAGVSPAFREFFGITTSSQEAQLSAEHPNLTFMDQNGSGAAITVNEIVCDQETVYVLMDFTAPEGTGLLSPERTEDGRDYWLGGREGDMNAVFFADAACTQRVNPRSWSSGFFAVEDPDPEDQVIPLLLQVTADTALPAEAEYLQVDHLSSLWVCQGGAPMEVMKDLDFSLVIPLETTAKIYSFNGRCGVNLGGITPAVVENLTISPVAVTMDLVIRDSEVYDAAHLGAGLPAGGKVLILRAEIGSPALTEAFKERTIAYDDIPVYKTVYENPRSEELRAALEAGEVPFVTFTSASTVKGLVSSVGEDADFSRFTALCIGEQTAAEARRHGMTVQIAREATIDAVVELAREAAATH